MKEYKVGTRINFKQQAKREALINELANTATMTAIICIFLYCIFA